MGVIEILRIGDCQVWITTRHCFKINSILIHIEFHIKSLCHRKRRIFTFQRNVEVYFHGCNLWMVSQGKAKEQNWKLWRVNLILSTMKNFKHSIHQIIIQSISHEFRIILATHINY